MALTEEAYERLKTIGEATELGSGFKIAMRDLEIRGAGNLLGEAQSGHIAAVGYDLYCQMVTEAVAEMKGEPVRPPAEIKLDVPDRRLPAAPTTWPRRSCGSRPTAAWPRVTTAGQVDDIRAEWEDRYGPLPAAGRGAADGRLPARRVPPPRHHRHRRSRPTRPASAPLELKLSQTTRLRRLARDAIYKEDARQLVVPIPRRREPAEFLVEFLRELVPADARTGRRRRGDPVASAP